MNLVAKLFDRTLKKGGIILIDSSGKKFICGRPDKKKPITVKLLKKKFELENNTKCGSCLSRGIH